GDGNLPSLGPQPTVERGRPPAHSPPADEPGARSSACGFDALLVLGVPVRRRDARPGTPERVRHARPRDVRLPRVSPGRNQSPRRTLKLARRLTGPPGARPPGADGGQGYLGGDPKD